jgi:dTDP-4-amino-4,6-dideoxygalactose transaminase
VSITELTAVPLLDLKAQYATIRDEIQVALDQVLESQRFILGPEVDAFEREVAEYSSCAFGVGVTSGSDALIAALMALDLQPGEEVITTPYTFFATAGAISRLGGRTVFVDIEPGTFNLDPALLEAAITPRTRAIIPIHLFGQMADMDPIMDVARRHKQPVIEDAAQAIGAEYHGQRAGSIGEMACFSFFPSKNLGAFGDAGMVTTNDGALADRLKLIRGHGARPKYYHQIVGGNFRIDALQAAVLRVKLRHLDDWTEGRQRNAARYRELFAEAGLVVPYGASASELAESSGVMLPVELPHVRHIYNQFVIRSGRRDALQQFLKERQIGTEIYYPVALHQQECFADLGYAAGAFPESERAAAESLAIPIYPELTDAMLEAVVDAIAEFYRI